MMINDVNTMTTDLRSRGQKWPIRDLFRLNDKLEQRIFCLNLMHNDLTKQSEQ